MATRRTRKDKEGAHHSFLYSWEGQPEGGQVRHGVKPQFKNEPKVVSRDFGKGKSADNLAKVGSLASIKRDMVKSLLLASLILGIEVVVYLAWF
ncbi:MAG: hypothetical protein AAB875_06345 [Patescibacteria group bacterium]